MTALVRPLHLARPGARLHRRFWWWAGTWAVLTGAITVYLADGSAASPSRLLLANVTFALALVFSLVLCARAARVRSDSRRAWAWMAVAQGAGAFGQVLFTASVAAGETSTPSPIADAFSYLTYAPPLIVALFCYPRPQERLISRFRNVLDALVITVGVLMVSEVTVLRAVRRSTNLSGAFSIGGLAYPVADIAICALVLTLGMLQPPRARLRWFFVGAGLLSLAITDSVAARLMAEGWTNLTATPLMGGWIAAPVLIALATLVPSSVESGRHWNFELAAKLLPYLPVFGAALAVGVSAVRNDPFLMATGVLLLLTVTVRQVMIVYENLTLTRDLEAKVEARTAELATLGSIVTSSQDAIVGLSMDTTVLAWNPAAEELFGHPAAEAIGRVPAFLLPASLERIGRLLLAAGQGEPLEGYEMDLARPDGSVVPVAVTVSPIHDGGRVVGISLSAQDITERRRAAEALEQAREAALQSSRLKSEFLATMSHEIRTPMNGVIGLTSLLMETDLDSQQRGYAEGVHSAGQSLLDVINDILDFSKLEAGKVVLDLDDFDLRRVVEEVGNLLAPAAFAKGLELLVDYPPDAPTTVRGDHVRIRQILLNLASNAVKFTSRGEVEIRVSPVPVEDGRVRLRFEVLDTGIGVAKADQERLFESFSQADASTTRRYGGTGLGLAICRRLVEVMKGEIGLRSAPGEGSTFWFQIELPLGTPARTTPAEALPDLPPGLRALVVDDNATNRTILEGQLGAWGIQVDLTENAVAALDLLRHADEEGRPYDLALLDMLMPEVDGLQLARAISADPALKGLPMIMLTSAQRLPAAVLREAGINRWLTKPVNSFELYDRVVRLVTRSEVTKAHPERRNSVVPATRGRILVVEDNALNQLVAAGLVARLGFEAETASNGAEALEVLAARGPFAAVLMDCHMPVMDGFLATEEIRRREPRGQRTPVIALTAGALVSDRERCLAAGMDDYVAKPIDADLLSTVLERWAPESAARPEDGVERAAPDEQPAALPGEPIDRERLAGLSSLVSPDGTHLLSSFVSAFTGRSGDRIQAIRRAVDRADAEALAMAAHELKGSAATIGADRVAALCAELEHAGGMALPPAPKLVAELEVELDRACRALVELVAANA